MEVAAENIARVARPSCADLEHFIGEQEPVIFTGLLRGHLLEEVESLEAAVARLGWLRLRVRPEYRWSIYEETRADVGKEAMTLGEFAEFKRRQPDNLLLCVEEPTPEALLSPEDVGDYARINVADGDRLSSRFFVGNAGNKSNLHFDRDCHAILLHQVYGRKRVILVAPRESQKLRPVKSYSEYQLHNFNPSDREAFLRYVNARQVVLHPGETLLIPAVFWHHVEYLDDAMSVNFKLRRNRYVRLLGSGLFHSNYVVQALVTKFLRGEEVEEKYPGVFDRLLAAYADEALDPFAKFEALEEIFRALYATICADFPQGDYFTSLLDVREIDLWRDQLESGKLYRRSPAVRSGVKDDAVGAAVSR